MNNKGFAITGIIYTLFIIFLMVLLSVLSGLKSYQRLMSNSISGLENSFEGVKLKDSSYEDNAIDGNGVVNYSGKYVFEKEGVTYMTYLGKGTNLKEDESYIYGVDS